MAFQIGWFHLHKKQTFHDNGYACAAWYRDIEVEAGRYPVMANDYEYNYATQAKTNRVDDRISVSLSGIITRSYFGTMFGGVAIGNNGVNEEVGKQASYYMSLFAHSVAKDILDGNCKIELLPEYEARPIPFTYLGEEKVTYGIFANFDIHKEG